MSPQEFIDLQQEILSHHPELQEKLNTQSNKDTAVLFAVIATYLEILLDGEYMLPDLARLFLKKLRDKRSGAVIILPAPGVVH